MLDDLAICIETQDVDACPMLVARPFLITMQDNVVIFGDDVLEMHLLARIFLRHPLKVRDERLLAIGHVWIVLVVDVADKFAHRLGWLALVEHRVIEASSVLLVALELVGHWEVSPAPY